MTPTSNSAVRHAIGLLHASAYCEALDIARNVLECDPSDAGAMQVIGLVHLNRREPTEAAHWLRRAVELQPNIPAFHNNLGEALRQFGRLDQAIQCFDRAIALKPDYAQAFHNRGLALRYQNRVPQAIASYETALRLSPDDPELHLNLAVALLVAGDLRRGFEEYEWRWRSPGFDDPARRFEQPQWKGEDLAGKTLLIHAEQGFGDSIQFARFVPIVAERCGASVILEVQPALKTLFASVPGRARPFGRGEPLPPFDLHCPMMSLPLALGIDLPALAAGASASVPYMRPDDALVARWQQRLPAAPGWMKVGLAWAGRESHKNDKNRSLVFDQLAPLFDIAGVSFVSLQQGPAARQLAHSKYAARVIDPGPLRDFAQTAALIANLDVVIAVDTAVAHLGGAMGKRIWLLNPFVSDWRWLTDRPDSPWYPTMKIFRQAAPGDWVQVIQSAAAGLRALV